MLGLAKSVAVACGITRLADVTGLDEIGLPVWQAIRPMSLSLSVHQGKGWSHDAARIGALMEGIECFHAENFVPVDTQLSIKTAMSKFGIKHMDDFLTRRTDVIDPETIIDWSITTPLAGGTAFAVPSLCASLDFTRDLDTVIERNSNGLSGGACLPDALLSGLCEVLERDAWSRARHWSTAKRAAHRITLVEIELPWLQQLLAKLRRLNFSLLCWDISSWSGLPCLQARLSDLSTGSMIDVPATDGWCCHPFKELALSGAILEAIQSRVTCVAGARDDIEDWTEQVKRQSNLYSALEALTPMGVQVRTWSAVPDWPLTNSAAWLEMIYERLHIAGVEQIGYLDLTQPHIGITVVKMFVPGLGMDERTPRWPPLETQV